MGDDAFIPASGPVMSKTPSNIAADIPVPSVVITSAGRNDTVSVAICGEVDVANQEAIHAALLNIVGSWQPRQMLLDLSRLDFCDCSGARMLSLVQREIAATGATCLAHSSQPHVDWLMDWMRQNPL
jgi:anti-anti-sigma factor